MQWMPRTMRRSSYRTRTSVGSAAGSPLLGSCWRKSDAGSVLRRVDLNFGRYLRGGKRFLELRLGVRLLHVVVRRYTEVHPRLDLRREQMRAVRVISHEPPAVE